MAELLAIVLANISSNQQIFFAAILLPLFVTTLHLAPLLCHYMRTDLHKGTNGTIQSDAGYRGSRG